MNMTTIVKTMPKKLSIWKYPVAVMSIVAATPLWADNVALPPLPSGARLTFQEDWSAGHVDKSKWYMLRKKWGQGNNGVRRITSRSNAIP